MFRCRVLPMGFAIGRIALLASIAPLAFAQVGPPGLNSDLLQSQFNGLEQNSARANQAVYGLLTAPDGVGCSDDQLEPDVVGNCSGAVYDVFASVREFVHTANELNGSGPNNFSLGLDAEGLGFALRWSAGEELAAQGASIREFSNSQLGVLANRVSALRFGAAGIRTAGLPLSRDTLVASTGPVTGGSIAKRWGVFLDGSYSYGDKDDTTFSDGFENAFDFDSQEVGLGIDYRLSPSTVVGLLAGYTDKEVDFDSSLSVVDGGIESDGFSVLLYGLWEAERLFVTGSVGGQRLTHDLTRRIVYPSFNPLVPVTDETAEGSTDSTALIASLSTGMTFQFGRLALEPFLAGDYQDVEVDAFTEQKSEGFDLSYARQDIKSLEFGAGLKISYVLTPSFGVLVPYLRAEWRLETEDDVRIIRARYAGLGELQAALDLADDFAIPTDTVDDSYLVLAAGGSMVLRGGLQGFLQFQAITGLDNYSENVISGGLRMEF